MSSFFTPEQLQELEKRYGLISKQGLIKVRDGLVSEGDYVHWRCADGPMYVKVDDHVENIKKHPDLYQILPPDVEIIYKD